MRPLVTNLTIALLLVSLVFSGDSRRVRAHEGTAVDVDSPAVSKDLFDPSIVRPSEGSNERRILEALSAGDRSGAYQLATIALEHATKSVAGRLHWLAAKAASDESAALRHLAALGESDHLLSRWAQLDRAELLRKTDPSAAAQISATISDSWVGARRAQRIRARALLDIGRVQEALPLLRALVRATPPKRDAAQEAMPLADYLAAKRGIEARKEALELYRRVASRSPTSRAGIEAQTKAQQTLARLPARIRARLAHETIDDMFYKGRALARNRKYAQAVSVFGDIAARTRRNDRAVFCKARLEQGKALLSQRKRKEGAKLLSATANACPDTDVRAWARYFAGRAYLRIAEPKAAIRQYRAIESEAPKHTLADDGLFRAALAAKDAGDEARMTQWLNELPKRYPHGDMRSEARFALIQSARHQKQWDEALRQLDLLLEEGADEGTEGMRGRARYWRAQTLYDLGRISEAVMQYEEVISNGPLDYYAQQALARLAEVDPPTVTRLLLQLEDEQPQQPLLFTRRVEMNHPCFERAIELLRVSEVRLAKQELGWMGALGRRADRDMLWLVAAMFDQAGAYVESTNLARRRLRSFTTRAPKADTRALWRIAYPRAFHPLIENVSKQFGIPAAFIRAVAREESGFEPTAVSPANAYGLIQLIAPTARRHAGELGLPSDPASLKLPEINLPIGANFIRYLWQRYQSNPAVVPAAYNAGQGAVDRWLRERPEQNLDAWIESIPYPETRRYTRRVLQSYGVYAWLDTGKFPPLPARLPQP